MKFNTWVSRIHSLDRQFLNNNSDLIKFLKLINSKFLTIYNYNDYFQNIISNDVHNNFKHKFNNNCIFIWDCEFQVIKMIHKNNNIQYDFINNHKAIRCISELGLLIFAKLNNTIYLISILHIGFMNHLFGHIKNYTPFYHDYISVNNETFSKIISIENNIYPHLIFEQIIDEFKKSNNRKLLSENIISLSKNKILIKNKTIFNKFKNQITELLQLLKKKTNINIINDHIIKIIKNLNNIIYNNIINDFHKSEEFSEIMSLYLNDTYVKSILANIHHHRHIVLYLNKIFSSGLNIIKGMEDVKAIQNHNILLNNQNYEISSANIIDIANYNTRIYNLCGSAKLYESYICLNKIYKQMDHERDILLILKKWMKLNFKPHNPLVDAYYTLQVFLLYNENL